LLTLGSSALPRFAEAVLIGSLFASRGLCLEPIVLHAVARTVAVGRHRLATTEKVGRVRRCMLAPYAFEGISTWLQRLDRFAQVVERTKGDR